MLKWWSHLERNEKLFFLFCVFPLLGSFLLSLLALIIWGQVVAWFVQLATMLAWAITVGIVLASEDRRLKAQAAQGDTDPTS